MPFDAAYSDGRALRILMVLESDFTQRGGGGAESQLRTLGMHLMRLGQQVAIVTPLLPYGPQVRHEECYGIPVDRLPYPHIKLVGAGVMLLRHALFLMGPGRDFDAWHVHIGHNLGAVTCLVGSLVGKPVVVKISGWWELERGLVASGGGLLRSVARNWLKRAAAIQAISTRIANELVEKGFPAERVLVLPNAVDTDRFHIERRPRAAGAPFRAVFVGRLVEEKGLSTLLDAWATAFGEGHNVRLQLVGGGPLEEPLREQAERLGIGSQVEFLGHRDQVEEVLAEAHVGILPSRIEGLSNTLLEFMASSLTPIASRVSGSEDFIKPGENGWLFPVSDVAALADCLREAERMAPEKLLALGQRARAHVVAEAALDSVVGRLMSLYRGAHPRDLERVN